MRKRNDKPETSADDPEWHSGGHRFDPVQLHQNASDPNGGRKAAVLYDEAVSGTIVYLDICALKRPFDDSRSDRIRRETEAVARIFEQVEKGVSSSLSHQPIDSRTTAILVKTGASLISGCRRRVDPSMSPRRSTNGHGC
jgi:hypothetical protein